MGFSTPLARIAFSCAAACYMVRSGSNAQPSHEGIGLATDVSRSIPRRVVLAPHHVLNPGNLPVKSSDLLANLLSAELAQAKSAEAVQSVVSRLLSYLDNSERLVTKTAGDSIQAAMTRAMATGDQKALKRLRADDLGVTVDLKWSGIARDNLSQALVPLILETKPSERGEYVDTLIKLGSSYRRAAGKFEGDVSGGFGALSDSSQAAREFAETVNQRTVVLEMSGSDEVPVTVRLVNQDGKELPGRYVWQAPKNVADKDSNFKRILGATSPTKPTPVKAGWIVFRARKGRQNDAPVELEDERLVKFDTREVTLQVDD